MINMKSGRAFFHRGALRVSLAYLVVAGLWILLSDHVSLRLFADLASYRTAQTIKGIIFVTSTTGLIYLLIWWEARKKRDAEQARAELTEALRESREQLQIFIDHAPVALAMFDSQMRYLSVSRRWMEDYRLGDKAIIGLCHYEVFPEIPERWKAVHRRALSGETLRSEEDAFVRADGSVQWLRWVVLPWRLGKGGVEGIIVFSEDITARKSAETRLTESERRWRFAIDGSELGLWDWNVPAGTVFFSSRWKSMLGFSDDEVSNQLSEWESRVHPDDKPAVMADVDRHFRGETEFYANEHRVRCKDGSYKWIMDRGKVVEYTPDGKPLRMIGTHTDLTALKERESALTLSACVFEESAEGIMICDRDKRIISVNHAFTDVTGYAAEEVVGKTPGILKSGRHDADFYRDMWRQIGLMGHWQGEIWNRRKSGEVYPEFLSINAAKDQTGAITYYFGLFSDISQSKQYEAHISHLVHYDALTNLPNRTLFDDRIRHAISHAQREKLSLALVFLDLDRFKNINDSLGHPVGDMLLVEVARRLESHMREEDTVSRQGGDEFTLLLPDTRAEGAVHVAGKILKAFSEPFLVEGHELNVTPSIGIAVYPVDGPDAESLLKCADAAMYRAKHDGRNTFRFFTAEMHMHVSHILQLENALRRALERQELMVYYQPQLELSSNRVIGCEALLRWKHPEFGMVMPADFIPIAEESGQILALGEWVLRTAVAQNKAWQAAGLPPLTMAVNLSVIQFRQGNLVHLARQILDEHRLEAQFLELELTEGIAMDDPDAAVGIMEHLHRYGIRLSIDDFGTGYSSLSYLKRFSIDKLKIDQSFVRDVTQDSENAAIVGAVVSLARSLGLRTIAEGVETVEQREFLRGMGCDEIQGYLVGRPMPAGEFEQLLRNAGR